MINKKWNKHLRKHYITVEGHITKKNLILINPLDINLPRKSIEKKKSIG